MNKILFFKLVLQDIFKLTGNVHIVRKRNLIWPGKIPCVGMYTGEMDSRGKYQHRIEYDDRTTDENIFGILAHEFVHAWQMENGLELEHDEQPEFVEWEGYFAHHFDVELQF